MDYCAVGSVKDLINLTLEPLDEPQLAEVCLGVVRGLSYLHARGISSHWEIIFDSSQESFIWTLRRETSCSLKMVRSSWVCCDV